MVTKTNNSKIGADPKSTKVKRMPKLVEKKKTTLKKASELEEKPSLDSTVVDMMEDIQRDFDAYIADKWTVINKMIDSKVKEEHETGLMFQSLIEKFGPLIGDAFMAGTICCTKRLTPKPLEKTDV